VPSETEVAARIEQAEDERYAAMLAADVAALTGLLSDRLVYAHSSGYLDTKQSLLAKIADGSIVYSSVEHPVKQIVVLGDAAFASGEMHADIILRGQPKHLANISLAVWAIEDGAWRLIAYQATPLAS
jgi:ketosteroid isomerase-like protein